MTKLGLVFPSMHPLRVGSTGAVVRRWQQFLAEQGYLPSGAVDGAFGVDTEAATQRWQTDHALTPTGVVGPLVWFKAQRVLAASGGAGGEAGGMGPDGAGGTGSIASSWAAVPAWTGGPSKGTVAGAAAGGVGIVALLALLAKLRRAAGGRA